MLTEKAIARLQSLTDYLDTRRNKLIIDGDTHPTDLSELQGDILKQYQREPGYYQGRPISEKELLESMNTSGVDMSLIWQNPAAFKYTDDKEANLQRLLNANLTISRFADEHPTRFIPAGWTDPKSLGVKGALNLVDVLVGELGFPIVKMNPAQNCYPIDSTDVFEVIARITSLGATPAFHFGGDSPYTPASGLEKILLRFPKSTVIGVHMGGGGSHYVHGDQTYLDARELGLKYPNLFYVLSAKRDCHIETDLKIYTAKGKPFNENIGWGSDAPYGLQSWNLGGYQKLFDTLSRAPSSGQNLFTPRIIQNYMGGNLAQVVIQSCTNVLEHAMKFSRQPWVL